MINNHLTISAKGLQWLQNLEQLRLHPYDDQTGESIDHWVPGATIGYGHLIAVEDWPRFSSGISTGQADELFDEDMQPFEAAIRQTITKQLRQYQFDALLSLAFNIGIAAFIGSSIVKMINSPGAVTRYATQEKAWKAFNKDRGRVVGGLINRREAEWLIWTSGIYQRL